MSAFALLEGDRRMAQLDERAPQGWGGIWYGVAPATVTDISDPDGQGRVQVTLPWCPDSGGGRYEAWARIATLFAGSDRGSWFIPDVGDEVLVAFEHGDPARPYVLGGLWNGSDSPPESASAQNNIKMIKSRSGVTITPAGVTLQAGGSTLAVTPQGIVITAPEVSIIGLNIRLN